MAGRVLARDGRWLQLYLRRALGLPLDLHLRRRVPDAHAHDLAAVTDAFVCACRFGHEAVALLVLERSIALDPELGKQVDGSLGCAAFVKYFIDTRVAHATTAVGPWKAFVMEQVSRAAHAGLLCRTAFATSSALPPHWR